MILRTLLPWFVFLLLGTVAPAAESRPSDAALVDALRAGRPIASADRPFAAAVRRIDALRGKLEFDGAGRLTGVDLAGDRISVADADIALLASLPRLRSVRLSGSEITTTGLVRLRPLADLAELALQDTQIDDAGLRKLTSLKRLETLSLRRANNLTDNALACLKEFPVLTRLALIEDGFSDEGLEYLKGLAQLRVLDLRGCSGVGDAGLARLKSLVHLRGLKIGGAAVSDAGLAVLKSFGYLQSLAIEDCSVSDAGLVQLEGLSIENLALVRCFSIGDAGLVHIKRFPLRQLALRDTAVTGDGLVQLAGMTTLRSLTLNRCGADDAGLERLAGLKNLARPRSPPNADQRSGSEDDRPILGPAVAGLGRRRHHRRRRRGAGGIETDRHAEPCRQRGSQRCRGGSTGEAQQFENVGSRPDRNYRSGRPSPARGIAGLQDCPGCKLAEGLAIVRWQPRRLGGIACPARAARMG